MISTTFRGMGVLWPMFRLLLANGGKGEAWQAIAYPLSSEMFGPGSREPFAKYLQPPLNRPAPTLDAIKAFLIECEYISDLELHGVSDHWLHPNGFEILRKGDCDDHALWAWRSLVEIGLAAELMVGQWNPDGNPGQHAWVTFRDQHGEWLLETVAKRRDLILRPLEAAKPFYSPHFSVDHRLGTRIYGGFLRHRRRDRAMWLWVFSLSFLVFFLGFQVVL